MRKLLPSGMIPSQDENQFPKWKGFDEFGHEVAYENFPGIKALRGEEVREGLRMIFKADRDTEQEVLVSSRTLRDEPDGKIMGSFIIIQKI